MKVVLILPTYNERENIIHLLDVLDQVARRIAGHTVEFLVVDDTSPDGTATLIETYQKTHPHVHLLIGKKQGLGKALLRGMSHAVDVLKAQILVQMDADLSHDPNIVPLLIGAIDRGADFAVGSRYIPGGSIPENWGLHRKLFSVLGNAIVRFGLGQPQVHDWTGGFRAYKKEFFDAAKHQLGAYSGYVFQIAFLHKSIQHNARVAEIPIHFTDRKYGHSKIAPSEYIRNVLLYVLKERYKRIRHGQFGKFLVVGSIGFFINTLLLELLVKYGFHPALGSVVGAECAILSNFYWNNAWTFRHRQATGLRMIKKLVQFNLASIGAIFIQGGIVFLGSVLFGAQWYRLYYLFGVGMGLLWNYFMYSRVIWKPTL